jgi:hypothetical protein
MGLLLRAASPPLRLAALRWPGSVASLERWWPPPGVSTACFVAVAHFSGTRFPRVPPSRMCPCSLEAYAAHSQGRHARRCATSRVLLSPWSSGPKEHVKGRIGDARRSGPTGAEPVISPVAFRSPACRSSFSDDWLRHAHCGETPSAAPGSATRVSQNLVWQQRPWARFSGSWAFCYVRLRLRSGSPPCGGKGRSPHSSGGGHLRASRRPASLPLRTSPVRASRGCPPRECAHAASKRMRHILKDGTPAVVRHHVLC